MKINVLRMSAATAMAAVAFGVAAPAASAVEHHRAEARAAATMQANSGLSAAEARTLLATPEFRGALTAGDRTNIQAVAAGTASEVQERAATKGAVSTFINLLRKGGPAVIKAAKKAASSYTSFQKWVDSHAWYHPYRIAWKTLSGSIQYEIYKQVRESF